MNDCLWPISWKDDLITQSSHLPFCIYPLTNSNIISCLSMVAVASEVTRDLIIKGEGTVSVFGE